MRKVCVSTVVALLLAGCVQVTSEALSSANPRQVALAKSAVQNIMKDPESTRFRNGYQAYQFSNGDTVICGSVNAKNSYGGYVGYKPFYVRLRGEEVMRVNTDRTAEVTCDGARSGSAVLMN